MSPDRLKELRLFNFWGLLFTISALLAGTLVYSSKAFPTEEEAVEGNPDYPKQKFRCCRAWKIYSFLFPVTIITEFVLTVYYWVFLWHGYCEIDGTRYEGDDWPARCYSIVFDHSIPLLTLTIDLFLNMQPFIRRHVTMMTFLVFVYIVFNFLWTIITKNPIYDTMDWKSLKGIATPIILLFMVPIIYFIFEKLNNRIKMLMCRQKNIVEIAEGKAWLEKQQLQHEEFEADAQGRLDLMAKFNQV
uniref:Uncharacterized protein n=1 Tax=Strombidium inclinatum TaxID=197538 RepID=A0A7S3IHY4_9SPIT|mmetsp:Transcript_2016/g.3004  ORF Transcript_2016/g.3004 Transcript_2016/m.3004 type:complete len:245 (+) Transcript_2016:296-1030(+)